MSRKMKNKNLKILLILILFLIVIFIILLSISNKINPLKNANGRLAYILEDETWEKYGEIYPDGSALLKRTYFGDLTIFSIGKSMYYVATDFLPYEHKILKNKNNKTFSKYYNKNSELLKIALGIENEKQFLEISDLLKSLNTNELKFESFYIDKNSIKAASTYTTANLIIKYKDCEEITLNMKINNRKYKDMSSITYTTIH